MDKEGKGQVGTPQKSVFHQQHPAAARSTGHIGEIQGTSDLRKERMLPACHVQPENEQLPQGNRRFLRHKEKSDHARCQAHFRNYYYFKSYLSVIQIITMRVFGKGNGLATCYLPLFT